MNTQVVLEVFQPNQKWCEITHAAGWGSCTVGLPKQSQVMVDWYELHCLGSPTAQLAHQHV